MCDGCPRQDSNLRSRLRRAVLYPLSYGGPGVFGPKETVPAVGAGRPIVPGRFEDSRALGPGAGIEGLATDRSGRVSG